MSSSSGAVTDRPPPSDGVVVGLRIRPLLSRDLADGSTECLKKVHGEPQVVLGADRAFTFNHVFDPACSQEALYEQCMADVGMMCDLDRWVEEAKLAEDVLRVQSKMGTEGSGIALRVRDRDSGDEVS